MMSTAAQGGRRLRRLLLLSAGGTLAATGMALVAAAGIGQPETAAIFLALVALGELCRVALPGDRVAAPVALASGLGYALLLQVGNQPAAYSASQVIAVTATGMFLGVLPRLAAGRPARWDAISRRLIVVSIAAFSFRALAQAPVTQARWADLAVMASCVFMSCVAGPGIAAFVRAGATRVRFRTAIADELHATAAVTAATGATAMIFAIATPVIGLASLLVLVLPAAAVQIAFRRTAAIQAASLNAIRGLSMVPEVGGYVSAGHAMRVTRLAVSMGRELAMSERELIELEYASLMHDIGQFRSPGPLPGGATVLAAPDEQRSISGFGAEMIENAGGLDPIADIIRRQYEPYLPGLPANRPAAQAQTSAAPPPRLASRIIKVADTFDDMTGGSTDPDRAAEILELLTLDSSSGYDPAVVEALHRSLAA